MSFIIDLFHCSIKNEGKISVLLFFLLLIRSHNTSPPFHWSSEIKIYLITGKNSDHKIILTMLGNMSERSSKISALEIMINNKSILSDAGGRSYHNLFRLTIVVSLICLSSFYFGFSLTYLSTVPTSTLVLSYGK